MLWGISDMANARAFQPLPLCSESPWNLPSRDFWSSRNERKALSKQKCVLRKCCWVSQIWWMLELSNLCHCVQHPWKLTSRDFWSSRNERKPLSKQKCVLRKCWYLKWYLEKPLPLWMLELSNLLPLCFLCHCVHPWKLTSRDFWSSRNERKSLSKQKCVLRKCCWVSQIWWMLELSNLCHCVQNPENLLVEISGALGMKETHFLSKNVFWENAVGYLRYGEC